MRPVAGVEPRKAAPRGRHSNDGAGRETSGGHYSRARAAWFEADATPRLGTCAFGSVTCKALDAVESFADGLGDRVQNPVQTPSRSLTAQNPKSSPL